jgi:hypothetical protein
LSATFDNYLQKWHFLKKCYDQIFAQLSFVLNKKAILWRKYVKKSKHRIPDLAGLNILEFPPKHLNLQLQRQRCRLDRFSK